MYLEQYFTTYDDSITQSSNIDPLGMTMIWSALGREIFHNRVSSISNDVRSYTLNLLHHYVLKTLVEKGAELSPVLKTMYGHCDALNFKQACLIYLENLFVFSMLSAEAKNEQRVETQGILGTSKARMMMGDEVPKRAMIFSLATEAQLLIRQLTLGVSGRYKTPFVEMQFFDKEYRYHQPNSLQAWRKTEQFMVENEALNRLANDLVRHLQCVIAMDQRQPHIHWPDIDSQIKSAYATLFASPAVVGRHSRDYWLSLTQLDCQAAGSLYQVLLNANGNIGSVQQRFEQAAELQTDVKEQQKLTNICLVEPLLAECELLFTLLMSARSQSPQELYAHYQALGRDVGSIVELARALRHNVAMLAAFSGRARQRFGELLKLGNLDANASLDNMNRLADALLGYHQTIMNQRGQSAWVERDDSNMLRCHIKLRNRPDLASRPYRSWYHRYYLDQFYQLICGLEGKSDD